MGRRDRGQTAGWAGRSGEPGGFSADRELGQRPGCAGSGDTSRRDTSSPGPVRGAEARPQPRDIATPTQRPGEQARNGQARLQARWRTAGMEHRHPQAVARLKTRSPTAPRGDTPLPLTGSCIRRNSQLIPSQIQIRGGVGGKLHPLTSILIKFYYSNKTHNCLTYDI